MSERWKKMVQILVAFNAYLDLHSNADLLFLLFYLFIYFIYFIFFYLFINLFIYLFVYLFILFVFCSVPGRC